LHWYSVRGHHEHIQIQPEAVVDELVLRLSCQQMVKFDFLNLLLRSLGQDVFEVFLGQSVCGCLGCSPTQSFMEFQNPVCSSQRNPTSYGQPTNDCSSALPLLIIA
jgi:hypothetical protein